MRVCLLHEQERNTVFSFFTLIMEWAYGVLIGVLYAFSSFLP